MIRTQVLLDNQIKKELLSYAQLYKKSISQITRESLRSFLVKSKKKRQIGLGGLQKLLEIRAIGGPKNLSEKIDEFLYQKP